jgi:hypothetical protein
MRFQEGSSLVSDCKNNEQIFCGHFCEIAVEKTRFFDGSRRLRRRKILRIL